MAGVQGAPPGRAGVNLPAQSPALCKRALWVQLLEDGDDLSRPAGEMIRERFGTRLVGLRPPELPLGADAQHIRRCRQTAA